MSRLLVIGCPRSGTHYTAKLLQHYGYDVQHERVGRDGCVSWMFAVDDPYGYPWRHENERPSDYAWTQVVHLVRHPLDCIASMLTIHEPTWEWVGRHVGRQDPGIYRAARFWYLWTAACDQQASCTLRVESLPDVSGLERNSRGHGALQWGSLGELERPIRGKAREYGYDD